MKNEKTLLMCRGSLAEGKNPLLLIGDIKINKISYQNLNS